MKKKILIIIGIAFVVAIASAFLISSGIKKFDELLFKWAESISLDDLESNAVGEGVYVDDNSDYKWFESDELGYTLYIMSEDATISGDAAYDTKVMFSEGIENVIIKDLDQGNYKIEIFLPLDTDCTLSFEESNSVYCIHGCDDLDMRGLHSTDEIVVTGQIEAHENLTLSSGIIKTGFLSAFNNINIIGDTELYIEPMKHESEVEFPYARISPYNKLKIDLNGNGFVNIATNKEYPSICATSGIFLGENTEINIPEEGYIDFTDNEFEDEYMIYNKNGSLAENILIKCVN